MSRSKSLTGDDLWAILETEAIYVDEDLKLILKAAKCDNIRLLAAFGKEDKLKIEKFMRELLHKLIGKEKWSEYYGIYVDKPELFSLVAGHDKQLDIISKACRKHIFAETAASKAPTDQTPPSQNSTRSMERSNEKPAPEMATTAAERTVLQKNSLDKNINEYLENNYAETLKVSSRVVEDGLGSFNAVVKCPVCDSQKKITKVGLRWSTSNFYAHIRTHESKEPDTKTVKIDSMFQTLKSDGGKKKSLTRKAGSSKSKTRTVDLDDESDLDGDIENIDIQQTDTTSGESSKTTTEDDVSERTVPQSPADNKDGDPNEPPMEIPSEESQDGNHF